MHIMEVPEMVDSAEKVGVERAVQGDDRGAERLGAVAVRVDAEQRVERVQLGVRMEVRMVKVLKGLAEFNDLTLGQLLEKIVLHSFEAVPGEEGEMAASPHGKRSLEVVADLKRIYGMDYETHATRHFADPAGIRDSK